MDKKFYLLSDIDSLKIYRDGSFEVLGLSNSNIEKDILTFAEDSHFFDEIKNNKRITCVITKKEYVDFFSDFIQGIVIAENPRLLFFTLHNLLSVTDKYHLPNKKTVIGKGCNISKKCYIDSENVVIGDNVIIEEFVSINGHCVIGDNVIIKSGCQIGSGGYEFKQNGNSFYNVNHCGRVIIGDNVIVWPNVTIHKAVYPWDATIIGSNTNINSQVHIDHGAKIGLRCEICAGAIISGRCNLEDNVFIGPRAVLANRIIVKKGGRVSIGAVVTKNVEAGNIVSGNFAIDHQKFLNFVKKIR